LARVPRAAGPRPGVALGAPGCPVLQHHPLAVGEQQPGGAAPAPVPCAAAALDPAVAGVGPGPVGHAAPAPVRTTAGADGDRVTGGRTPPGRSCAAARVASGAPRLPGRW